MFDDATAVTAERLRVLLYVDKNRSLVCTCALLVGRRQENKWLWVMEMASVGSRVIE